MYQLYLYLSIYLYFNGPGPTGPLRPCMRQRVLVIKRRCEMKQGTGLSYGCEGDSLLVEEESNEIKEEQDGP